MFEFIGLSVSNFFLSKLFLSKFSVVQTLSKPYYLSSLFISTFPSLRPNGAIIHHVPKATCQKRKSVAAALLIMPASAPIRATSLIKLELVYCKFAILPTSIKHIWLCHATATCMARLSTTDFYNSNMRAKICCHLSSPKTGILTLPVCDVGNRGDW
jgi:hypothetical protein